MENIIGNWRPPYQVRDSPLPRILKKCPSFLCIAGATMLFPKYFTFANGMNASAPLSGR